MEQNRKNKLLFGLCVAAGILIAKLFSIQIIDDRYKMDADNNSMVYSVIYPTRGIIHDRNGNILVGNKVAYDIVVTPREVETFDTLALAEALDVSPDFIREKMAEYRKNRRRIGTAAAGSGSVGCQDSYKFTAGCQSHIHMYHSPSSNFQLPVNS